MAKAYIIGAGPGGPGLMTLRAVRCLAAADVVLYDRLVDERVLRFARRGAELIFVGKSSSSHSMEQDEINALMIEKAREDKCVVRLKGGDPYVFGRGGEEAIALRDAGIDFEVVPGITAAGALGAYAGIPLTHRALAASVALATGHEDPAKGEPQVDWQTLARAADTIGIYMGVKRLGKIVEKLLSAGLAPETPAAIVRNCAAPSQRTVVATLGEIAGIAEREQIHPPAVTIIGKVVSLRDKLNWFERLPLFGRKVLVTRAKDRAAELSDILEELGAYALEIPMIRIEPPEDTHPLDEAVENLRRYDWLVFTSVNGVDAFVDRMRALNRDARALYRIRICCIGPATAARVEQHFLKVDCIPERFVSEEIPKAMLKCGTLREKDILMPRADIASPDLAEQLRALGACVTDVVAYRTLPAEFDADGLFARLGAGEIDAVTLASASTARNLAATLGWKRVKDIADKSIFAAIGPVTARAAREAGIPVTIEAAEHTLSGLVQALVEHFGSEKEETK